jgi:hypothetical protein
MPLKKAALPALEAMLPHSDPGSPSDVCALCDTLASVGVNGVEKRGHPSFNKQIADSVTSVMLFS